MKEKTLQTRIINFLENDGWIVLKMPPVKTGIPDVMAFRNKITIFLEIKKEKNGKLGYFQAVWIKKLRQQGFTAEVIDSWDIFKEIYGTL